MMRGIPAAGLGLALARDGSSVHPVAGVHVPHLSLGSLRATLQCFARAATHALRSAPLVLLLAIKSKPASCPS